MRRTRAKIDRGLRELALGGTAVGQVSTDMLIFRERSAHIEQRTGIAFLEARTISKRRAGRTRCGSERPSKDDRRHLFKIANDIRWLGTVRGAASARSNFPHATGHSIMPGKVTGDVRIGHDGVRAVIGNDTCITWGGQTEISINVMMP